MSSLPQTLVVLGPTASGKTQLAVGLAQKLNGEVLSADSRQVYRGMDLGTGKDLEEYGQIPYHLINIKDPSEDFSVFDFQRAFYPAYEDVQQRGKTPVICGGTGLYLDAVIFGYDLPEVPPNPELRAELTPCSLEALGEKLKALKPELHNTTDLTHKKRLIRAIEIASAPPTKAPTYPKLENPFVLGLKWDRAVLRKRITQRLKDRIEAGFLDEVQTLTDGGLSFEKLDFFGLEYRFAGQHLQGKLNRNDMFQKLNSAIHQFAKRQDTWFRRMEKKGCTIHWVNGAKDPLAEALDLLETV